MKLGKIGKRNAEANRILKKIYIKKGIDQCELKFPGCWGDRSLAFAHRKTRRHYYKTPQKLSDFKETLLACVICHERIEHDKKLSEYYFKALRNNLN